jgi:mono/diheme cytochrome c family protein
LRTRTLRGPSLALATVALVAVTACRRDMQDQPRYKPLAASDFFKDGASARPLVPDTVARGEARLDSLLYTGKVDGVLVDEFPFPITKAVLDRGQQRFDIFCSPCHGPLGDGDGMVVRRGFKILPPSYHIDRLRDAPVGHFFDVMTNGFGAMQDYRAQVSVRDRWAIAAYIRALQLSQHATMADVPPAERAPLDRQAPSGQESQR